MSPRNCLLLSSVVAVICVARVVVADASAQEHQGIVLAGLVMKQEPESALRSPGEEPERAEENHQLSEFLIGTRWLMYEIPGRIVEFGENGNFELDDWKMQGIEARWKATGPKQVTVTVVSQKFKNLTATLNFDDRLSFFTGTDLDHHRRITKSPRIHRVPNDPADPYHR